MTKTSNIIQVFTLIIISIAICFCSCRFSNPIFSIRVKKNSDTIVRKIDTTLEGNSFQAKDTSVFIKYRRYICLDWTNRSFFGEFRITKIYNLNKILIERHIYRKVPAFIYDGWVRTYQKSIIYSGKQITRKDYYITQWHGIGASRRHIRTVTFDYNGNKAISKK